MYQRDIGLDGDCNTNELLLPTDYCVFRKDREHKKGGGVLIAAKSLFSPQRMHEFECDELEIVVVEIVCNKSKWLIVCLYRPPNAKTDYLDKLENVVERLQLSCHNYQGVMVVGDFNIDWTEQGQNRCRLEQIFDVMNMTQCVNEITRPHIDDFKEGSVIDLVFVNRPELCQSVEVIANCVQSDHNAVRISLKCVKPQPPKAIIRQFLCYKRADFDHMKRLLELAPWDLFMDENDVDQTWDGFLDICMAIVNDCIPTKQSKPKRKFCPWITKEVLLLMKKRDVCYKRAKNSIHDAEIDDETRLFCGENTK